MAHCSSALCCQEAEPPDSSQAFQKSVFQKSGEIPPAWLWCLSINQWQPHKWRQYLYSGHTVKSLLVGHKTEGGILLVQISKIIEFPYSPSMEIWSQLLSLSAFNKIVATALFKQWTVKTMWNYQIVTGKCSPKSVTSRVFAEILIDVPSVSLWSLFLALFLAILSTMHTSLQLV